MTPRRINTEKHSVYKRQKKDNVLCESVRVRVGLHKYYSILQQIDSYKATYPYMVTEWPWNKSYPTLLWPPWTVACQTPLSLQFPRQNTGVGCHFLLQEIFLHQGSNTSPAFTGKFFTTEPPSKPMCVCVCVCVCV